MKPLHERLHLYTEADDTYIFVPVDDGIETRSITVHRSSGDIVLNGPNTPLPSSARRSSRTIHGIVGVISLSLSEYIIVITGRELKGRLLGHDIYRASDFDILPLSPNVSVHNPQHPVEAHLLALVSSHLRGGNFLFAYGWDLTRRLQAQWESQEDAAHKSVWEMADDRFFWNRYLQTRLIDANANQDPDLQIMDLQESADMMKIHLQELVSIYGNQYLVNLVNHKGYEKPVKDAFERYITEYFDFHTECKNMRWDRISILTDILKDDLEKEGYFRLDASEPEPLKLQKGVVRTNCMDTLDRTNVVQGALAKFAINKQLAELGILPAGASIDDYEDFSKDFREMWADHGDAIATAYAGSGALKSDFTRTNKRTRKGLLEDGAKSLLRYVKNNYFDGARQDAFDLVTGTWIPRKSPASAILLTAALIFIFIHGIDYVSWPRLIPPTDVIYYNGPGYRSGNHGKGLQNNIEVAKRMKWLGTKRTRLGAEHIELGEIKKRVD
ncbi:hypothetical protein H0H93_012018 [Arthromyces matolae]|nr:hypothetical protein H0H93_012018 [Arthromyces matolae]